MKFKSITVFIIIALFVSCTKKTELENALEMAGANRAELEKVLTHYSKSPSDSLKLRAAEFLICNMICHYTMESKSLSGYYKEIVRLNNDSIKAENCKSIFDSLGTKYRAETKDLKVKFDIQTVKSDYLINNIENAIHLWYTIPWLSHLTFADFCEYVLPYRVENENLEEWREDLKSIYLKKIGWIENIDDTKQSSFYAASNLNDTLKLKGINTIYPFKKASPINLPASALTNIKLGTCEDFAASTLLKMRACGIPACIDFTPHYPNRNGGHTWNVVFGELGKEFPFLGGEQGPGYFPRAADRLAKVYRRTFTYQYKSLFDVKKHEEVPPLFNTPYLQDVTNHYVSTADIEIELVGKTKKRFAYLAVFDNANWVPVQWGEVKNGNKVAFKFMGKNCMYLPMLYNEGVYTPVGKPFYINYQNKVEEINTSAQKKQTLILDRKYPIKRIIYMNSVQIIGTLFEASNSPSFNDSVFIAKIKADPKFYWDTLRTNTNAKYRYWRIRSTGIKKNTSSMAELQFIANSKNITDSTKIKCNIGTIDKKYPLNLFDNNPLTYIELKRNSNEWITFDFCKPVAVDYFRFLPRNDDNAIVAGDSYELMMWDKTGWKSLIKCIAKSDKLILRNVPSGGLYLLHNHTKGNEERIFTYENGKQVWW